MIQFVLYGDLICKFRHNHDVARCFREGLSSERIHAIFPIKYFWSSSNSSNFSIPHQKFSCTISTDNASFAPTLNLTLFYTKLVEPIGISQQTLSIHHYFALNSLNPSVFRKKKSLNPSLFHINYAKILPNIVNLFIFCIVNTQPNTVC